MFDPVEQLVWDSQFSVAIVANPDRWDDVEFVSINSSPIPEGVLTDIRRRGLYRVGAAGLVNGSVRAAFDVELDGRTSFALAQAVIKYFLVRFGFDLMPEPKGDSAAWLLALHKLEDPRV